MTTKTPPTQAIIVASFVALFLSGCAIANDKPPIEIVYQLQYTKTFHLKDYFIPFQNGFLHIVLFLLLFTTFQFWQNQRRDYLCYSLYLLITWLYFARAFSVYFYPFFSDHDSFCDFDSWLKKFADQTEFIFFCVLTSCYLLFVFAFFELKKNEPIAFRVTCYTLYALTMAAIIQLIVLILSHGKNYLLGLPETMLKNMFTLPAAWLMVRIMRAKLPGVSYIVIGSGALLAGSIWVGI